MENHVFPGYKKYIGQKELLFSNTLSVGEIYKIHGCCTQPESMIMTDADYRDFNNRNAYLASKLITIFVEHPIVFIGHSLTDPNIRSLLKSISMCVGDDNVERLQNNLIFVDRKQPTGGAVIENAYLNFDSVNIPVKVVKTSDFRPVYSTIGKFERKLPARVLRFCKERVFEIVKTATPEKRIAVMDFDSVEDPDSVEVVFGIGVLDRFGDQGYVAVTTNDLFEDLIFQNGKYNPRKIIDITFSSLSSQTKFVPVFKYLQGAGIDSKEKYQASGLKLDRLLRYSAADFSANAYPIAYQKYKGYTTSDFLKTATESEIVSLLPLLPNPNLDVLEAYLRDNFEDIMASKYKYHYRRIMSFYDWAKYGFS